MTRLTHQARLAVSLFVCGATIGLTDANAQIASPDRLLVLLRDASELAIVDPVNRTVLGRVATGRDPHEVTASDDGQYAFVTSMVDGISVIDLAAQQEIRRVNPGNGSGTHDGIFSDDKLYFTIEGYKSIGRYDPVADEIEWTLGIGQEGTHMLVHDATTNTMFMPNTRSNSITVVDNINAGPSAATLTVIPVPGDLPEGLDLSPNGQELWTATRNDGGISIIDVESRQVIDTIDLGMRDANRLKFTDDGRVLIIDGEAASLVVMDATSRNEIKRISVGTTDTSDGAVLVGPNNSHAYLGLRAADRVAVVDLDTLTVIHEIPMGDGSGPGCMYWVRSN